MIKNDMYIKQSLDLNLFFLRIMKEHSLFLAVAFPLKNEDLFEEARKYNVAFNSLLNRAVELSQGIININDDAVTKYTLEAEKATAFLTGFPIDTNLTETEFKLSKNRLYNQDDNILVEKVRDLNDKAILATKSLIRFKTKVLDGVLSCKLFTGNYPLLIEHIRREALLFADSLTKLQKGEDANNIEEAIKQEIFWNRIMGEHSEFIRGFLDPTEKELMSLANNFAIQFEAMTKKAYNASKNPELFDKVTNESLKLTKEVNGFKIQGTEGILNCSIKSIIVPLLGDHVIRESNHFLHILENAKKQK